MRDYGLRLFPALTSDQAQPDQAAADQSQRGWFGAGAASSNWMYSEALSLPILETPPLIAAADTVKTMLFTVPPAATGSAKVAVASQTGRFPTPVVTQPVKVLPDAVDVSIAPFPVTPEGVAEVWVQVH